MWVMKWDQIARRQGGIITNRQLIATGMMRGSLATLLARAVLTPTAYRGVYRVAGAPQSPDAEAWLTVLGSRAVLSFTSAAQWWDLPVDGDNRIHVTRHDRQRFDAQPLVRIHRTRLPPAAITERFGLDVTTRRETLLDCLGWIPAPTARTLLVRTFQQSRLSPPDLERRLQNESGRWGNRQLSQLLRDSRPGAEADSERRLHKLLRDAGIDGWQANLPVVIGGRRFRLDVAFPDHLLDVEVDGWAFHRSKDRRDQDMLRANALTAAGWRVLTFSWEDVRYRPDYVVHSIAALLTARAAK
jgi:very-short-patch-repair endonuclease